MNFLLKKLADLKHVSFSYRWRLLLFQFKKTVRFSFTERDYELNTFLTTHLLRFNAFLVNEDKTTYTSDFYFEFKNSTRITLRKSPSSDFAVFEQVFVLHEYDPVVEMIKSSSVDKGQPLNIMDAGGNIGLTSLLLNNMFPGSSFAIVEPDIQNFRILEKNIGQNNFSSCKLIYGGVWNKNTDLSVNRDFRDGNDWSVNVTESDVPTGLKGFTILYLMETLGFQTIDILKIDIEGAEKQLFSDPLIAKEFLSKTKYICIEIHDEFKCRNQINECLAENNFEFFLKDGLTVGKNKSLVNKSTKN